MATVQVMMEVEEHMAVELAEVIVLKGRVLVEAEEVSLVVIEVIVDVEEVGPVVVVHTVRGGAGGGRGGESGGGFLLRWRLWWCWFWRQKRRLVTWSGGSGGSRPPAMVEVDTAVELVEDMVLGVRMVVEAKEVTLVVVEAVLGVVRVVVMVAMCLENTLLTVCMIKNLFLPKVLGKINLNAVRR